MFIQDKMNIFNGNRVKTYYTIFNIIAITAMVYIGVDTFYRAMRIRFVQVDTNAPVSGAAEKETAVTESDLEDYQIITDRNIFSKVNVNASDLGDTAAEASIKTSLKLKLRGTFTGNDKVAAAFIEDTALKMQGFYRIGQGVQGAVITSIARGKVILKTGTREETLTMDEDAGGETAATPVTAAGDVSTAAEAGATEQTTPLKRTDINTALDNPNALFSQANIQPHITDGETDGMTVTNIKSGTLLRKMGLRSGDIVKSVNDTPIKSTEDLIAMYNNLKSDSEITMQIVRRNQEITKNFTITD